jgi:hypothetical protein
MISILNKLIFLDERRLLALVPKGQKKKAKYLLNEFNERGDELTWNTGKYFSK